MAGPGDNIRKKPAKPVDTEPFKRAVTACMRAMAAEPELEVVFAADKPAFAGKHARLPDLPKRITRNDVMVTRGVGDSMALRTACHNPRIHAAAAPDGADARAVFDAVEQARVEAIGARRMPGVGDNITAMIDDKFTRANLSAVTEREQAPLAEAVALLVREKLTGRPTPPGASAVADLWRDWIDDKASGDFAGLEASIDDQNAFARAVRDMLVSMELADEMSGEQPEDSDEDNEDEPNADDDTEGGNQEDTGEEQSEAEESQAESEQPEAGEMDASQATTDDMEEDLDADAEEPGEAIRPEQPYSDILSGIDYKIFSTEFDETVPAEELCDEAELERLRAISTSSSPIRRASSPGSPTGCSAA
jgi:cobaltochelatase CobT